MFAVGVDEMSWDDLNEAHYDWPPVNEVRAYREQVRALVSNLIETQPLSLPITWESPWWVIIMGIEHLRIHVETSSVLIRQLSLQEIKSQGSPDTRMWPVCPRGIGESLESAPKNELVSVKGVKALNIGRQYDDPVYGWDNEYGDHVESVSDFKSSKYLATNAQFLEFMLEGDGGYHTQRYWTPEGWSWKTYMKQEHPVFWVKMDTIVPELSGTIVDKNEIADKSSSGHEVADKGSSGHEIADKSSSGHDIADKSIGEKHKSGSGWKLRTLHQLVDMPWSWPVEVNYLEAKAFCNWLSEKTGQSVRMATEHEWHVMRQSMVEQDEQTEWKQAPGNINLEYWASSCPVDQFQQTSTGLYDVMGNVWQWSETPIHAFTGFRTHKCYDDFSLPTFDNKHNLIKGGSWVTTGNEAMSKSRYAFRRHFFQHAGFRYVVSTQHVKIGQSIYESDVLESQYLEFHYGQEQYFSVPNFMQRVATLATQFAQKYVIQCTRALDLGCAVGRATFELAKSFKHVTGLDFSANFILIGAQLQNILEMKYKRPTEGDLTEDRIASLKQLQLDDTVKRVEFFQADACNLNSKWSNYDLVLAANLVDRLYKPELFLRTIHQHMNMNGLLIITSPYTWLVEYTERDKWIGGYVDLKSGKSVSTLDGLKHHLSDHFELLEEPQDVPFVIRETSRKHQHTVSQMTVWKLIK